MTRYLRPALLCLAIAGGVLFGATSQQLLAQTPATRTIVLDDVNQGTTSFSAQPGTILESATGGGFRGAYHIYNASSNTQGLVSVLWRSTVVPPGTYDVWMTWVSSSQYSMNMNLTVLEGGANTALLRKSFSERVTPAGVTAGGVLWQNMGAIQVRQGTDIRVYLYGSGQEQFSADAALLVSRSAPACGDGIKQANEECDDGNRIDWDGCSNLCRLPKCGDGVRQRNEQCDDGNIRSGDGCSWNCFRELSVSSVSFASVPMGVGSSSARPVCGNGLLEAGEQCDDGNRVNDDSCTNICRNPRCGDGILQSGEECDDGNTFFGDRCTPFCRISFRLSSASSFSSLATYLPSSSNAVSVPAQNFCGDGIRWGNEQCDDGNTISGDGCSSICIIEIPVSSASSILSVISNLSSAPVAVCGNGNKEGEEECDDGNILAGDWCTPDCLISFPFSASSISSEGAHFISSSSVSSAFFSSFFSSPSFSSSSSASSIQIVQLLCGNGIKQDAEECDDGNTVNDDACTNDCKVARCGDTIVQEGEQCDDGNTSNTDLCTTQCRNAVCGDGIQQGAEECDDGNTVNTDGCTNVCSLPKCGDGIKQGTEQCDDGNTDNTDACTDMCARAACGDGFLQGTEQCDDGNTDNADLCTNTCRDARCGDHIVQNGEECDDGNASGTDLCTAECRLARCGDGFRQGSEECDDGNSDNTDRCTNTCKVARCGDGIVQEGETCDDGNTDNTDGCTTSCRAARCGDGFTWKDQEQCDDGNAANTDACTATCLLARCGDSFRQSGEECDDGNSEDIDSCTNACKTARCGDGFIQGDEECDAGAISSEACSSSCKIIACGNGRKEGTEECDDGNQSDTDSCTNTCTTRRCGDGFLQSGEECDDGNTENADACTNACKKSKCGDGAVQTGEVCDDGNTVDTDGCTTTCVLPRCGDGFLQGTEECDDGNTENADTCTNACKNARCGDIILQPGEECDDGNTFDTDLCTSSCKKASCGDGYLQPGEQCDDSNTVNDDACTNECKTMRCGDSIIQGTEQCDDGNADDTDDCTHQCMRTFCGDGIKQAEEECDDGNAINTDLCTSTCKKASCGDTFTQPGEQCDDGNSDSTDLCTSSCKAARCGDGIQQGSEECDDGNASDTDLCTSACKKAVCGDGIKQEEEECDDGNTVEEDSCTTLCKSAVCGDGFIQSGEECDDGNAINTDMCTAACKKAACGDGIKQPGEGCDDRNTLDGDGCSSECQTVLCGNGIVEKNEQCDDGNTLNDDGCSNACKLPVCGDGLPQGTEACDDGNQSNKDSCMNTCVKASCGDGFLQDGQEECDDGNTVSGDGCSQTCVQETLVALSLTGATRAYAGSTVELRAIVENKGPGTAKNVSVTLPLADGDVFIPADSDTSCSTLPSSPGAHCDAGDLQPNGRKAILVALRTPLTNRDGTYEASVLLTTPSASGSTLRTPPHLLSVLSCGNGTTETSLGEECDDGNADNTDSCTNSCKAPACGDSFIQEEEMCDDGNTTDGDGCSAACVTEQNEGQRSPFDLQPISIPAGDMKTVPALTFEQFRAASSRMANTLLAQVAGGEETPPPAPQTGTARNIIPGNLPLLFAVDDRCRRERKEKGTSGFFDPLLPSPPPRKDGITMEDAAYEVRLGTDTFYDDLWKKVKEDTCVIGVTVPGKGETGTTGSSGGGSMAYLDANKYNQAKSFFQKNVSYYDRKNKVVVATIDTGFDLENNPSAPELSKNMEGSNRAASRFCGAGMSCTPAEYPDIPQDRTGHGTAVGSIITTRMGSYPFEGLASMNAVLLPIEIARNEKDMKGLSSSDLFNAIKHAVNAGADVINLSITEYDKDLCNPIIGHAIYKALENDVFFVFSAGNGTKIDKNGVSIPGRLIWPSDDRPAVFGTTVAPACWGRYFQGAVTVGGLETGVDRLHRTSNYGDAVELLAPATNIASYGLGNTVTGNDGTSFAAPQVAAAASLVIGYFKQRNWYYDAWMVEDILENSARKVASLENRVRRGRVLDFQALADYLHTLDGMSDDERRRIPSDNPRAGQGWKPDEDVESLDHILIQPERASLLPGESMRFHATVIRKDGTHQEVTKDAFWTTQSGTLLPITADGQVTLTTDVKALGNIRQLRIMGHYENLEAEYMVEIGQALPAGFVSTGLKMQQPGVLLKDADGSPEKPFRLEWGKTGLPLQLLEVFKRGDETLERDRTPEAVWSSSMEAELSFLPAARGFATTLNAYGGKRYTVQAVIGSQNVTAVVEVPVAGPGVCLGRTGYGPTCILSPLGKSVFQGQPITLQALLNVAGENTDRPVRAQWASLSTDLTLEAADTKEVRIETENLPLGTYTVQITTPFRGRGTDEEFVANRSFTVVAGFDRVELITKTPILNYQKRALFVLRRYDTGNAYTVFPPSEVTWTTSDPVRLPIDAQGIVYPSRASLEADGSAVTYTVSATFNGRTTSAPIRIVKFDTQTGQKSQLEYIEIAGIPVDARGNYTSFGPQRCTYSPPTMLPAPKLLPWGWKGLPSTYFTVLGHESDGRVCNLTSPYSATDDIATVTIDNAKMLSVGGPSYILPITEKAGIPVKVTALYGRGLKAQAEMSVPKYPFKDIGFNVYYSYVYPDRNGAWVPIRPDGAGIFHGTGTYMPVDRFQIFTRPVFQIFDPIQNLTREALPDSASTNNLLPRSWTTDHPVLNRVKTPYNNQGLLFPVVEGNRWEETALFHDETVPVRFQTVYRGNGEEETVEKSLTLHLNTPVVIPPLLDFTASFLGSTVPENLLNNSLRSRYQGDINIPMLKRDVDRLQIVFQTAGGGKVGWSTYAADTNSWIGWETWGDDAIGSKWNVTVTHPGIPKTHTGSVRVNGATDYSTGTGSLQLPELTELTTKADDPRCSDSANTSSGSFAGGLGTEGDPFIICTGDQLRNMITNVEATARRSCGESMSLPACIANFLYGLPKNNYPAICADPRADYFEKEYRCQRNHFRLAANIDFGSADELEPIPFAGFLEGDGHEISNPTIVDSLGSSISLFSSSQDGRYLPIYSQSIRNLIIRNPTIRGNEYVAALIARPITENSSGYRSMEIENVHVVGGQVWGRSGIGGLVAVAGKVNIRHSSVRDTLISFERGMVGGLVSYQNGAALRITDSISTARLQAVGVQGGQGIVGGIIGQATTKAGPSGPADILFDPLSDEQYAALIRTVFKGSITMGHSGNGSNAGGLIGYNGGMPIVASRAEADIAVTGSNVGGLVGLWQCNSRYDIGCGISHSSFKGTVWGGAGKDGGSYLGGLVGATYRGMILDSRVESGSILKGTYGIGGIVGNAQTPYLRIYRTVSDAEVDSSSGAHGGFIGTLADWGRTSYQFGDNYTPAPVLRDNFWSRTQTPEVGDVGKYGGQRNADLEGVMAQ